jgi:hypothetical protein
VILESVFAADVSKPLRPTPLPQMLLCQDNRANRISVRCMDGETPLSLSGSCMGYALRADLATVPMEGEVSGEKISITLPEEAYAVPGPITITLQYEENGAKTTLFCGMGTVIAGVSDDLAVPGDVLPDIKVLYAAMERLIYAPGVSAVNFWGGEISVSAHGLSISRNGNEISISGTGTQAGTLYLDLTDGGLTIAENGQQTQGALMLRSGHTYGMRGVFTGSASDESPAPLGNFASVSMPGSGMRSINAELPQAQGAALSADASTAILLAVRTGVTVGGTVYPSTFENYKIALTLTDHFDAAQ